MKKYLTVFLALACMASLAACAGRTAQKDSGTPDNAEVPEDQFVINIVCQDKDIDQISYAAYVDGERRSMGRQAVLENGKDTTYTFTLRFSPDDFEKGDDVSQFSIALSPSREGEKESVDTTDLVAIPIEYGSACAMTLFEDGGRYTAELLET